MSWQSFSRKRLSVIQLSLLASICLASVSSARPAFYSVDSTPYDRQMARVRPALTTTGTETINDVSMATVNEWMSKLRQMPYRYSKQWRTPNEVAAMKTADCKGK